MLRIVSGRCLECGGVQGLSLDMIRMKTTEPSGGRQTEDTGELDLRL